MIEFKDIDLSQLSIEELYEIKSLVEELIHDKLHPVIYGPVRLVSLLDIATEFAASIKGPKPVITKDMIIQMMRESGASEEYL
jgi:hypothetical protein